MVQALFTFLLLCQGGGSKPRIDDLPSVIALVRATGYGYIPASNNEETGDLIRDGVRVRLTTISHRRRSADGRPGHLRLEWGSRMNLPRPVRPSEVRRWTASHDVPNRTDFWTHLDGSVTVLRDIVDSPIPTASKLREELDRTQRIFDQFAIDHGGAIVRSARRSWTAADFPDDLVMEEGDAESLLWLMEAWGWLDARSTFYPFSGPNEALSIEGTKLDLGIDPRNQNGGSKTVTLATSWQGRETLVELARRAPWATWREARPGQTFGTATIGLEGGIKLGEFRRRIASFAARMRSLSSSSRAPAPQ